MICPECGSANEMAYSVLSNGMICVEPGCAFEIEMDRRQAQEIRGTAEEICY
jgi:hypothetical protein